MNPKSYTALHTHTWYSNTHGIRDSIANPIELLDYSRSNGLNGLVVTEHEGLSSHIELLKHYKKNKDSYGDFKLGFGVESYIVDREDVKNAVDNNEKTRYYHFILIAKDKIGYDYLLRHSSHAWKQSFFHRGVNRTPTYYDELKSMIGDAKGHVIGMSGCVGGVIPQLILKYHETHSREDYDAIIERINYFIDVFGKDDFYLEMQAGDDEQKIVNDYLVKISRKFGLRFTVTNDAHYVEKKDKPIHEIYLKASNPDRDVSSFYSYNYVMTADEMSEYFDDKAILQEAFDNTNHIYEQLEYYDLEHSAIMPEPHIPDFTASKTNQYIGMIVDKYSNIDSFARADNKADRYYLELILRGMESHNQEFNDNNLQRIDTELDVVRQMSNHFKQPLSKYFLAEKEFIDIIWEHSLLGVGRGSAACFYTNYLLEIVTLNPLDENYDLPHFRFANTARIESMFDIDADSQSTQRENIIEGVKDKFGHDKVINIGTFTKEGSRSTILTVARGLGLSISQSNAILDLLPNEKAESWSIHDAVYGNKKKDRKPSDVFIRELEKTPLLKEACLKIQGCISGVSQHASGVSVTGDSYTNHFPSMKTSNGLLVSQWDAHGVESVGVIKYDFLSINALDRINEGIQLLLKDGLIKWQGDLKTTYNHYFHPDKMNVNDSAMYEKLYHKDVWKVFQFSSGVAEQGLQKVKPDNFIELATTNSLIRLTTDGEQLIDKYVRFKNNIDLWYQEMSDNGLNEFEQRVLEKYLLKTSGIMDSQEKLMRVCMDKDIANFSMKDANKIRKSVAKKDEKLQELEKDVFFNKCLENGTSNEFANYVWKYLITPQFGYSFSEPHTYSYTMIAIVEMAISAYYPDIYWKTASLSVDAGVYGGEFKGTDYPSIAKAVIPNKNIVELPNINKSDVGFTPLVEDNKSVILFGLGAINGLNLSDITTIIEHRPYNNFVNFMKKVGNEFSQKKIITLIKSGVFHEFVPSTRELAIKYLQKYTVRKKKLTTVQLPRIINDVPDEYKEVADLYMFKQRLFGRKPEKMCDDIEETFFDKFEPLGVEHEYVNGLLTINKDSIEKVFKHLSSGLKEWLKSKEAIELLAVSEMRDTWIKEFEGNEPKWYLNTLSYYPFEHQLNLTNLLSKVNLDSFSQLPEQAISGGQKRKKYQKGIIAGTVLDKDKRGIITVVTNTSEVINVRVRKDSYGIYNKKVTGSESSWFERGTTLLFAGYRRGTDFVASHYGTSLDNDVMRIDGYKEVDLISR